MTPPERAELPEPCRRALLEIARLIVAAMVEADPEVREVTLAEAVRRLMELIKKGD